MTPPEHGLFGPDSVTWQLHADPAMWVAGISSLYLQALHPRAVAAIVQNSDFRADPLGRLVRTADFVGVSTYGTVPEIEALSARVRRVHASLRARDADTGAPFRLDEPELLRWVHCAEVVSFLRVVRRAGFPLSDEQGDRYVDEQRRSAALVGLDPADIPGSVTELAVYLRGMRPALRRTEDADVIHDFLHRPPVRGALRLGLPLYEPILGHLAYSVLPRWAIRCYGRRAYPAPVATGMLRALRTTAITLPKRGYGPHADAAIVRLGKNAAPSVRRMRA